MLDYEDERLQDHAQELVAKLNQELGEAEEEEGSDDEGEWEDEDEDQNSDEDMVEN